MNITVNDEALTLHHTLTLVDMLSMLSQGSSGTAVAVNQTIVPRDAWPTYQLQEGDDVVIFQAIAGG